MAVPGLLIFAGSVGAPCVKGIPTCNGCIERKICLVSPGFFTARNLALAEIYHKIGRFYKRLGNFDISERFYLASLKYENPSERIFDLAYLYFEKKHGRFDERVVSLFEEGLKIYPYYGVGRRELGRMYIQIGQVDKGIEYVLRSTESNPAGIPEAYAVVAKAYFKIGNLEKAINYAKMALEEIENSPLKRKYGLPIQVFDERRVRALAFFVLGFSYARLQKYDEAEKYLKMAMEIIPSPEIINLLNRGEFEEVEKFLEFFEP